MALKRFLAKHLKLLVQDIAEQHALPIQSLTGYFISKLNSRRTRRIKYAAVNALDIQPDDNILEIGFGRGDGISKVLEALQNGKGRIFAIDQSIYMESVARKRFVLEIEEDRVLRLERAVDLSTLPYPTDFFNGIFHVDSFYFWGRDMHSICRDLLRVLIPGGTLICGMQLSRLRKLEKWKILDEAQYNPVRYLSVLEPCGFTDVKMEYIKLDDESEIQLIKAKKPTAFDDYYNPEIRMKELEMDVKREMLARRLLKEGKPIYDSETTKTL